MAPVVTFVLVLAVLLRLLVVVVVVAVVAEEGILALFQGLDLRWARFFEPDLLSEEMDRLFTVHFEPVRADQVLLVEYRVIWAQETKVLKLEQKNKVEKCLVFFLQMLFKHSSVHNNMHILFAHIYINMLMQCACNIT